MCADECIRQFFGRRQVGQRTQQNNGITFWFQIKQREKPPLWWLIGYQLAPALGFVMIFSSRGTA